MKVDNPLTVAPIYSDQQPRTMSPSAQPAASSSCSCPDSSSISSVAKEMFFSLHIQSEPEKDHKSPFCIPLSDKDKMRILQLQGLKRILLGKKIKIKAPCCLEEWQKQLREEDQDQKTTSTWEEDKPCSCGCGNSIQTVNLLA